MERPDGTFDLTSSTSVLVERGSAQARAIGDYLAEMINGATGYQLTPIETERAEAVSGAILLTTRNATTSLAPEGYELTIGPTSIVIRAPEASGLFYGVQTLRHILPPAIEGKRPPTDETPWSVPCLQIKDGPRFGWRGLMIDCSRTFQRKEYLKRYVDLLALFKMNVLHLHLTDDQGWRVEIKKHVKLTEIGSEFAEYYNEPGGYYTQADLREIVAYAASRHVLVVPEIEMPGHCIAALAAYPELSCTGGPFEIHPFFKGPGIHGDVFCPGNEDTFKLLQDVLDEVIELFSSPFIHIGGDEVPKARWKQCPKCRARIKAEGLENEDELQSYFVRRIERYINSKGRRLIGWDEIMQGGLAPNATVMSWRGVEPGLNAINQGHDVVFTPTSHCYFDYTHERISLEKTYSFDPVASGVTADQIQHILGLQANMWTHIARSDDGIDRQIFPRLIALAEVAWSPPEQRDYSDFERRLGAALARLDALSMKYHAESLVTEPPELVSVRKIWDQAPHNAFTDLIRFHDRWYCTFREADGHVKGDGKLRVIVSENGDTWRSAALLAEDGVDLRDPKLSVTPSGRLMIVAGGSVYRDGKFIGRQPRVAFSDDGLDWQPLQRVLDEGDWLWRVTWHNGRAYGVTYNVHSEPEGEWALELVVSDDGVHYERIAKFGIRNRPNETTLRFLPGDEMMALVRREAGNKHGWIGTSRPPYTFWTWHEIDHRLGGPNFIRLPDGSLWAGSRSYEDGARTVLARLGPDTYEPVLTLPSGGDCSYPGMVWHDGLLWMSYYSSHEGKTSIYLAKIRLPESDR